MIQIYRGFTPKTAVFLEIANIIRRPCGSFQFACNPHGVNLREFYAGSLILYKYEVNSLGIGFEIYIEGAETIQVGDHVFVYSYLKTKEGKTIPSTRWAEEEIKKDVEKCKRCYDIRYGE